MSFWSKAKGFFGRIGDGIKKGAKWLWNNKNKVIDTAQDVANLTGVGGAVNPLIDKAQGILNKIG